jgi:hypothetical protein
MDTLTGHTTRAVTFSVVDHATKRVTDTRTYPAGTMVYAAFTRRGLKVRVPGTLFVQYVAASDVQPA